MVIVAFYFLFVFFLVLLSVFLALAAIRGNTAIIELLVSRNADVRSINMRGNTAFDVASTVCTADVLLLLKHGASNTYTRDLVRRLGQANDYPQWREFGRAARFARSLKFAQKAEWTAFCKTAAKPEDIPVDPQFVYEHLGWLNWSQWLGCARTGGGSTVRTPQANSPFAPFDKACSFVNTLNLRTRAEWDAWKNSGSRPTHIPAGPERVYKHCGWRGYRHWLGSTGARGKGRVPHVQRGVRGVRFLPFDQALALVHSLKLQSYAEWSWWCTSGGRPDTIPAVPHLAYTQRCGWQGFGHWLNIRGYTAKHDRKYDRQRGPVAGPSIADYESKWRAGNVWIRDVFCCPYARNKCPIMNQRITDVGS